MMEKYRACMLLSASGDALGYKNGQFEFNNSGPDIHKKVKKLGGVGKIAVKKPSWIVSDDTVMHLATAEALVEHGKNNSNNALFRTLAAKYIECMNDMAGRAPGNTCMAKTMLLDPSKNDGYLIAYNKYGAGCGAAMRAMCVGLRYPSLELQDQLIAVSTESGRMTHHHPLGFLGAVTAALFTSYAIQGVPVIKWGSSLLEVLPKSLEYIKTTGWCYTESKNDWDTFTDRWKSYLECRGIKDGTSEPKFPEKFGVEERDGFYVSRAVNPSRWPGATGVDSAMIAYDALLGSGDSWEELCSRGMFHCGDSDSTGVMAAAWFGALYGLDKVPECSYGEVEYRSRLEECAVKLYELSHASEAVSTQQTVTVGS